MTSPPRSVHRPLPWGTPGRFALVLAVAWTAVVAASLAWNLARQAEWSLESARIHARTALEKDVLYRRWAAWTGGVYVPRSERTPPNPFLDHPHRDVVTAEGLALTLINPAYMTRQVYDLAGEKAGLQARITDLAPLRAANRPDPWEARALAAFRQGAAEASSVEDLEGVLHLRVMRPLESEEGCRHCHPGAAEAEQPTHGGLSVAVDLRPYQASRREAVAGLAAAHGLLWLLGVGGLALGTGRLGRGQRALAESEARFQMLFHQAPLGYQSLDAEGRVLEINDTWLRLTGYARDEVVGRPFAEFLGDGARAAFPDHFARFREQGEVHDLTYPLCRRDGTPLWVALHGKVGRDLEGRFLQTHCIVKDVTVEQETEARRQELEIRLAQAQKMEALGTLAGGIAHDFNNILAGISGHAELALRRAAEGSAERRHLGHILAAADRAGEVARQILTFSRRSESRRIFVRWADVLDETLALLRASSSPMIDVQVRCEPEGGPVVADPTQLQQVLLNLCTNACQAMAATGGVLAVAVEDVELPTGAWVRLSVSDTGPGMDRATLGRAFEPYFTTKPAGTGTGLGLAVVHGIVESHGGTVRVESEPGRGATFSVLLPRANGGAGVRAAAPAAAPGGSERILLVDDEPQLVELAREFLADLGYRVTGVFCPADALAALRAGPGDFDCLVTDETMPELSGTALAEAARRLRPRLPVVLCTGDPGRLEESAGWADAFLHKPFRLDALARAVRRAVDGG